MEQGKPLHHVYKEDSNEGTKDHNALQRQIDDAAAFGEHAGQRHDHQGDSVKQRLLDQKCHARSPPFSAEASSTALTSAGLSGAACAGLPFLRLLSSILMSREKALR